ncbi:uncharacterized protein LOC111326028 [Stylophora pistillata]|uniref:uncharacterized protein LOC111326028 n=1 Tax=Stylophora pistillata TaxID=50429 RepID=UPI000C03A3A9|nr:uncharacterized protein LOC111326028 [Stylophora pistillata]
MYQQHVEKIDTLSELHLCRGSNDAEKAVEIVLNEGIEIDIPGQSNRTPLMWTSASSSSEFIQTLIDLGAQVSTQRPADNVTPLNVAVVNNNYVAVKILFYHGAKMGLQDNYGDLPLHDSARRGFFNVSKLLIDSGCDINMRNNNEETPLYVAVENKHVHLVKCLLEGGADVNMKYCKENE